MGNVNYFGFVRASFPDTPFSFVKGLLAHLNGGQLPVEPFESYVRVACGKDVDGVLAHFQGGRGNLWGQLGRCYELIYWASGGKYWANELEEACQKGELRGPGSFEMEVWYRVDDHTWEYVGTWQFDGVRWESVRHGDDQGVSDCWGMAGFSYLSLRHKEGDYSGRVVKIPSSVKWPGLSIGRLLVEYGVNSGV